MNIYGGPNLGNGRTSVSGRADENAIDYMYGYVGKIRMTGQEGTDYIEDLYGQARIFAIG